MLFYVLCLTLDKRRMRLTTPVVLLVFNRPDLTRRLFETIRNLRPLRLIVVQDGPRETHPQDQQLCAEVRRIVTDIDWPCQADGIFSETNMGCALRVSSGLSQVFEVEENAIILEDDCIPDPSFFSYCEDLLTRYADDKRVMAISGNNFHFGGFTPPHSYYFSRYFHCWGWATWRRAWKLYDHSMPYWPELRRDGWLSSMFSNHLEVEHWRAAFDNVMAGQLDSWAYRYTYAIWQHHGLTILPRHNMVSNIGFGEQSTNTTQAKHPYANMARAPLPLPLTHPPHMIRNFLADQRYSQLSYVPYNKGSSW